MDHAATMRSTYELINAGDIARFGDLVADDFVEHQGGPGFPTTKEGTLDFFRALLTSFPDFRMNVEDLIADGDKTVARVRVTGTHQGRVHGCAADRYGRRDGAHRHHAVRRSRPGLRALGCRGHAVAHAAARRRPHRRSGVEALNAGLDAPSALDAEEEL